MRIDRRLLPALFAGLSLSLFSCVQKMGKQGHSEVFGPGALASSPSLVRTPPADTIARGQLPQSPGQSGEAVPQKMPMVITSPLLQRGRERYNIYCAPCHDYTGGGHGMIVQRGFLAPPSYHEDRLKTAPDGHYFEVITHGYGAMYSYADRVNPDDRWAIVAYIRALQLSQNAHLQDLSPAEQKRLQEMPQ